MVIVGEECLFSLYLFWCKYSLGFFGFIVVVLVKELVLLKNLVVWLFILFVVFFIWLLFVLEKIFCLKKERGNFLFLNWSLLLIFELLYVIFLLIWCFFLFFGDVLFICGFNDKWFMIFRWVLLFCNLFCSFLLFWFEYFVEFECLWL